MATRYGPALSTNQFHVEVNGDLLGGWHRVVLPSSSTEQGEYQQGSDPDWQQQVWGASTDSDLVLHRGIQAGDTELWEWYLDARESQFDDARREVIITMLDTNGTPQIQWTFENAWVTDYDPPDLGGDGGTPVERVRVAYDSFERSDGSEIDD